jgi:hypothetical protein
MRGCASAYLSAPAINRCCQVVQAGETNATFRLELILDALYKLQPFINSPPFHFTRPFLKLSPLWQQLDVLNGPTANGKKFPLSFNSTSHHSSTLSFYETFLLLASDNPALRQSPSGSLQLSG